VQTGFYNHESGRWINFVYGKPCNGAAHKLLQDGPQTVRDKNEVTNDPGLRDRRASRKLFDILLHVHPLSLLFLSLQILSWRERARELPRLHLSASGSYYEIGQIDDVINVKLSTH